MKSVVNDDMNEKRTARRRWLTHELPQLLLLFTLIMAGRSTLADHYFVPSGSMEYTLMPGDRVFVDKMAYGVRIPFTNIDLIPRHRVGRGEVVIFDSPADGKRLIKRVVAVAGDRVAMNQGMLSINGRRLATEPGVWTELIGERAVQLNLQHGGGPDIVDLTIPEGMVLAVGDHRGRSLDGRIFGLVREAEIYGRAVAVYYRQGDGFRWQSL